MRRPRGRPPEGAFLVVTRPAPEAGVGQDGGVPRHAPRHDHDAGGPADLLAAKAALRDQVWAAMTAARVARFPGAAARATGVAGRPHAEGKPRLRPTSGAPARAGGRQDRVHGRATAGRARAVLRPGPGPPERI